MDPATETTPTPEEKPVEAAVPQPEATPPQPPVPAPQEAVKTPPAAVTYVKQNAKTIAVVVIMIVLASAYFHQVQTNDNLKKQTQHGTAAAAASLQAKQLVSEVGALVELPSNETPTVASVSDVSKLQNQAFFANAKNGDKVLLFAKAKQAILYRPSTHKVVQIAPLNPGAATDSSGNTSVNGSTDSTGATTP